MNKDTYEETIAKDAGISKPTVNKAIKHLVANGDITVRKEGRRNIYKFNPLSKNFEMFTYNTTKNIHHSNPYVQRRRRVWKNDILRFGISRANWIKCDIEEIKNWKIKESYKYLIRG